MSGMMFDRTARLLGPEAMRRLGDVRVIVFGVGGVGSWTAETLVRTGIRHLTIVDADRVAESNINRQLPALSTTVGKVKTEVLRQHLLEINPEAEITAIHGLYTADSADSFDLTEWDYVVDAIDSLSDKALLILRATEAMAVTSGGPHPVRFYSSMGAALKMDPSRIGVAEFWKVKGVLWLRRCAVGSRSQVSFRPESSNVFIPTNLSGIIRILPLMVRKQP